MADRYTHDDEGRPYKNGVLQVSSSPDPTPGGAIKAMIAALAGAFAPRSIVNRPQAIQGAVDNATGAQPAGQLSDQFN